jgi:acyl carrier protein phosphodiesterase
MALRIVEASVFGQTVETASSNAAKQRAAEAQELPALAALLDQAIVAELDEAIAEVLARLQAQAALHAGAAHLMNALLPLARAARYGDVRGTKAERVLPVLEGLFERALVALPGALASLDDDAALQMLEAVESVEQSLRLLDKPQWREEWLQTLADLSARDGIHGLLRGRFARIRLDASALDAEGLQTLARLALAAATSAPQAGSWLEGLLRGGALAVLHQDGVWRALDGWLSDLREEAFTEALPLVRRAFSSFGAGERRAMADKVKRFGGGPAAQAAPLEDDLDEVRVSLVLPVLAKILGGGNV